MLYVVTTAKMCSFTKAADTLYVSQSSVSQAIKSIEEELNTTLFIRHNNKISLTQAGEIFVNEAEKIIERSEMLKKRIIEFSDETKNIVKFGLSSFYSKYYLPKIIPILEKQFPNINFTFTEDISFSLETMVSGDILDFCMVPCPIAHADLSSVALKDERILLAVPPTHPLCAKYPEYSTLSLTEVCDEPFVFLKAFQRFTDLGMKLCQQSGFVPNIVYESMNWETIDALVAQNIGVGLVPDVVTNIGGTHKPVYYYIDSDMAHRPYALVYKNNFYQVSKYKSVINCVEQIFKDKSV